MPIRFEFQKNGQPVRTTGIDTQGVLSFTLTHSSAHPDDHLSTNVLRLQASGESPHMQQWSLPEFHVGDELTLRVLPAGEFDSPETLSDFVHQTVDDH